MRKEFSRLLLHTIEQRFRDAVSDDGQEAHVLERIVDEAGEVGTFDRIGILELADVDLRNGGCHQELLEAKCSCRRGPVCRRYSPLVFTVLAA
ncbi:hypothetical protein D3C86_1839460 [compost metagenome]